MSPEIKILVFIWQWVETVAPGIIRADDGSRLVKLGVSQVGKFKLI